MAAIGAAIANAVQQYRRGQIQKAKPRAARRPNVAGYNKGRARLNVKAELKCLDTTAFTTNFKSTPDFNLLNSLVVGTEIWHRIGRKIYMKSVHIRGFILNNATIAATCCGRLMLVYDSQPDGAAPTIANILFDQAPSGAASTVHSGINLAFRQRFTILKEKFITLPSVTNTAGQLTNLAYANTSHEDFNVNWFVKLKGLETIFAGSAGNVADIQSGALWLLAVSDVADSKWQFTGNIRLRYFD